MATFVDRVAHVPRERAESRQAGALQRERTVVAGEPLGEPQLARHVRLFQVERLERLRPDSLDVPGVEELVRDGVEQLEAAGLNRRWRGEHRAVAMLHAVAVRPRQVVGDERVGVALERRVLAEHVARLPDDRLDVADQAVHSASVPVWCTATRKTGVRRSSGTVNDRSVNALNSAGLSIRYWRLGAVKVSGSLPGEQLRRDAP